MNYESTYSKNIRARSKFRFLKGLYPRSKNYLLQKYINWIARKNGAEIGKFVNIPYKLAKKANSNLIIGDHTSIATHLIDMRTQVKIGSHCVVGSDVQIFTCSHNIDSVDWEQKDYGIEIEDYCWLATRAFILPSCRKIGKGAVCAAGSVNFHNIEAMSVVTGNPAKHLRFRKDVHSELCVESLLGNDLVAYLEAYKTRNKFKAIVV